MQSPSIIDYLISQKATLDDQDAHNEIFGKTPARNLCEYFFTNLEDIIYSKEYRLANQTSHSI